MQFFSLLNWSASAGIAILCACANEQSAGEGQGGGGGTKNCWGYCAPSSECGTVTDICGGVRKCGACPSMLTCAPALYLCKCEQKCQDTQLAFGIAKTIGGVYNLLVGGQPVGPGGAVNKTSACLKSENGSAGSVTISGTAKTAGSETALHLVYAFSDCAWAADGFALHFTGSVSEDGTLSSNSVDLGYAGNSLRAAGGVWPTGDAKHFSKIDVTCPIALTRKTNISGTICGRKLD